MNWKFSWSAWMRAASRVLYSRSFSFNDSICGFGRWVSSAEAPEVAVAESVLQRYARNLIENRMNRPFNPAANYLVHLFVMLQSWLIAASACRRTAMLLRTTIRAVPSNMAVLAR